MGIVQNVPDKPVAHHLPIFIFFHVHGGEINLFVHELFEIRERLFHFGPADVVADEQQIDRQLRLASEDSGKHDGPIDDGVVACEDGRGLKVHVVAAMAS